jgi:hypothetical protein
MALSPLRKPCRRIDRALATRQNPQLRTNSNPSLLWEKTMNRILSLLAGGACANALVGLSASA